MGFEVIDTKTGEYADTEKIVLYESWAEDLIYCDIDGFYIDENGSLYLRDVRGNMAECPDGRFKVRFFEEWGEEE